MDSCVEMLDQCVRGLEFQPGEYLKYSKGPCKHFEIMSVWGGETGNGPENGDSGRLSVSSPHVTMCHQQGRLMSLGLHFLIYKMGRVMLASICGAVGIHRKAVCVNCRANPSICDCVCVMSFLHIVLSFQPWSPGNVISLQVCALTRDLGRVSV